MSATEDDTELRDLLIQNLENNGVLNKLKAEMRAAVFLAMEEQDRLENKSPLINENLKKFLNTKDGRLVASLIMDFLQVFHLDFSLAVFQPEINSPNGLDSRDTVCKDLGLESEGRNSPLLLELVRRGRRRPAEGDRNILKEPSQKQISLARDKFDFYDKDGSGAVARDDLRNLFTELLPGVSRTLLDSFLGAELAAADRSCSNTLDFQGFLVLYQRLFSQCRSVVVQDAAEEPPSAPALSKDPETGPSLGKGDFQQRPDLDLEVDDDPDDGDSFFDDPLPKPQKTYGCAVPLREEGLSGPGVSPMRRGRSLSDLSVLAADACLSDPSSDPSPTSELRKVEASGARGSPAGSLSEAKRPGPGGGSSASEQSSRNGASYSKDRGFRDSKAQNDRTGSLHLDDDVEYDDDFNSHRSDLSRSELSIGEEIEEVSIEGPDHSDKLDETQDLSVSQLSQSHGADYMEDVS